jgi:hypothetical protein
MSDSKGTYKLPHNIRIQIEMAIEALQSGDPKTAVELIKEIVEGRVP